MEISTLEFEHITFVQPKIAELVSACNNKKFYYYITLSDERILNFFYTVRCKFQKTDMRIPETLNTNRCYTIKFSKNDKNNEVKDYTHKQFQFLHFLLQK